MLNAAPVGLVYNQILKKFLLVRRELAWDLPAAAIATTEECEPAVLIHSIAAATLVMCEPTYRLGEDAADVPQRKSFWLCFSKNNHPVIQQRSELTAAEFVDRDTLLQRTSHRLAAPFKALVASIR